MKKLVSFLIVIAVVLVSFNSCDQLDPIIPLSIRYNSDTYGPAPLFSNATTEMKFQQVLIEDFTGHTCGNCPAAAIIAEDIQEEFSEKVSVIAVHAGSYAEVHADHYTVDWTCPDGDLLWSRVAVQQNPTGRINRAPDESASSFYASWESDTEDYFTNSPIAVMQMQASYFQEANDLNVHVFTEFLENYGGNAKLSIVITESHIIGDQKDYSQDDELVEDYEFNHMMRGTVSGGLGILIAEAPASGKTYQNDYTVEFNPDWIAENCHLVAVLTDADSGMVINITEIDVIQ